MSAGAATLPQILLLVLYPVALCAAIATDLARRIIPNLLVAALLVGFALLACAMPLPGLMLRLAVAGAGLAFGFALFAEGVIGAGDAKLAAVLLLWLDPAQVPAFLLLCGLLGGVLVLAVSACPPAASQPGEGPGPRAALRLAASLPYGVAIAGAGLVLSPAGALLG